MAVQDFAVDDAVKVATKAGVKFPTPTLKGAKLAVVVTKYGLEGGTYYEGVMLDHLVTHGIHEAVMADIDTKYGKAADANYHRIADQAHYDLAQALGAKTVGLASYHRTGSARSSRVEDTAGAALARLPFLYSGGTPPRC